MEEKTLSSTIFGGCIVKSGKYVFFGLVDALPADENNHALITLASGGCINIHLEASGWNLYV